MSQSFQVKVKGAIPYNIAEEMRGWFSYPLFVGMECCRRQVSEQLDATYFYPELGDLRQRLAALEADPSPILEAMNEWYFLPQEQGIDRSRQIPLILQAMREFVDCYEEAVVHKTDWAPWTHVRPIDDDGDEVIQKQEEHEEEPVPNPPDSSSVADGDAFNVQFGDPSLMEQAFETVPGEMHRRPYIVLW
jgi:hypothetical protein